MGCSGAADGTGIRDDLLRKTENRGRKEERRRKERGDLQRGACLRTRNRGIGERGRTGPTHQGFSLGSGMILIHFASLVLNCSPLFLVSVWIPLTFEDHLCNLFSVLGRL